MLFVARTTQVPQRSGDETKGVRVVPVEELATIAQVRRSRHG